jgi:hypothetical protein
MEGRLKWSFFEMLALAARGAAARFFRRVSRRERNA